MNYKEAERRIKEIRKLIPEYEKDRHEHQLACKHLTDTITSLHDEKNQLVSNLNAISI